MLQSATEEATPPISARPSEVSVPPPKLSSAKPKSGSFSVVVHRHVVSIKPNSTNSSSALHSLVSKVSPESSTPPRSPSTRSTPARALSPLAHRSPACRMVSFLRHLLLRLAPARQTAFFRPRRISPQLHALPIRILVPFLLRRPIVLPLLPCIPSS